MYLYLSRRICRQLRLAARDDHWVERVAHRCMRHDWRAAWTESQSVPRNDRIAELVGRGGVYHRRVRWLCHLAGVVTGVGV